MARRKWTEEEKKAFGDKMRAARAAKLQEAKDVIESAKPTLNPGLGEEAPQDISNDELEELRRQVQELTAYIKGGSPQQPAEKDVKLLGFFEKYKVGKDYYPNQTERLANEPKLQRFAFKENYELNYWVDDSKYTTAEGIRMIEPKFHLDLVRVVFDEETGQPTDGRYIVRRLVFHEDPDAAIAIANDNGLEIDAENERQFLNEMRYLRQRDWLLGIFYPQPASRIRNKKEVVIGNQLVEYYEINSTDTQAMPFDDLSTKVRV